MIALEYALLWGLTTEEQTRYLWMCAPAGEAATQELQAGRSNLRLQEIRSKVDRLGQSVDRLDARFGDVLEKLGKISESAKASPPARPAAGMTAVVPRAWASAAGRRHG